MSTCRYRCISEEIGLGDAVLEPYVCDAQVHIYLSIYTYIYIYTLISVYIQLHRYVYI